MEFQNTVVMHESWRVQSDGTFHQYEGELEARRGDGPGFTRCQVGPRLFAVFVDGAPLESIKAKMMANLPDWLDALIYLHIGADADTAVARIDAELANRRGVELEMCAFVAACAATGAGLFNVEPAHYLVRAIGHGVFDVAIDFDWETETWSGDAFAVLEHGQADE